MLFIYIYIIIVIRKLLQKSANVTQYANKY